MFTSFPDTLPSLFFEPRRYRPNGIGYWSGHIPFACDLIHTLQPSTLVELGTHTGESYFAFCQAIEESGVACQAFAVDTWCGDQHTGAYGDDVFAEVHECNKQYANFSKLLRMTFDDAVLQFANDSIDLLHIDGAHTYDAVRHDFELWWPKVRSGGVVIMHDSHERGHDFGVWKFLEELQSRFPAREFVHSHGLAVICRPPLPNKSHVASEFAAGNEESAHRMRRYYEVCGANLQQNYLNNFRRPSDWDVTSQLFWRRRDESFSELNSIRAAHIIGDLPVAVRLPLPDTRDPITELRIAVTLTPALLGLRRVRLLTGAGEVVWRMTAEDDLETWKASGLRAMLDDDTNAALLFDVPGRAVFNLSSTREILGTGNAISLELQGFDPHAFAAKLGSRAPTSRSILGRAFRTKFR